MLYLPYMAESITKDKLKEHISSVHEKSKDFQCDFCDKSFSQKSHKKTHIASVHEEKRPIKCEFCNFTSFLSLT